MTARFADCARLYMVSTAHPLQPLQAEILYLAAVTLFIITIIIIIIIIIVIIIMILVLLHVIIELWHYYDEYHSQSAAKSSLQFKSTSLQV